MADEKPCPIADGVVAPPETLNTCGAESTVEKRLTWEEFFARAQEAYDKTALWEEPAWWKQAMKEARMAALKARAAEAGGSAHSSAPGSSTAAVVPGTPKARLQQAPKPNKRRRISPSRRTSEPDQ